RHRKPGSPGIAIDLQFVVAAIGGGTNDKMSGSRIKDHFGTAECREIATPAYEAVRLIAHKIKSTAGDVMKSKSVGHKAIVIAAGKELRHQSAVIVIARTD